jgi:hypothetical protein
MREEPASSDRLLPVPVTSLTGTEVSRRTVLGLLGGGMLAGIAMPHVKLAGLLSGTPAGRSEFWRAVADSVEASFGPALSYQASVTRREDMCNLSFDFYNLTLNTSGSEPELVPVNPKATSYLAVIFPAQHVGEEAVDGTTAPPWPTPPIPGVLAGPSQLVFSLPKGTSLPFTLESLLTWGSLTPELTDAAKSPKGTPAAPTSLQTAIEAPWSLFISPEADGTWINPTSPVTVSGNTEIWQTRLGEGTLEPPAVNPPIKAVWTPGYPDSPNTDPFLMSLTGANRADIVAQTCGGLSATGAPLKGVAIPADLVILTALGASLNLNGSWNPEEGVSLIGWLHRTSTGRDSYVRVVELGYLYPFGHQAVRITITDRQFQVDTAGNAVAYLVQDTYIDVVQPLLDYDKVKGEPNHGRQNPLRTVKVKTSTTPALQTNSVTDPDIVVGSFATTDAIWVRSTNFTDVPFAFSAQDVEGRTIDFSTGVIWVDSTVVESTTNVAALIADYEAATASRRTPSFGGQLLAFAEVESTGPGATAQHVDSYELDGVQTTKPGGIQPGFFPAMAAADIRLPAAEQIAGAGSPVNPANVSFYGPFITSGFEKNSPEVYLMVNASSSTIAVPAKLSGGSATPSLTVQGVARDLGPVGGASTADLDNLVKGLFDPSSFFSTGAMLLGAIDLAEIIEAITSVDKTKTKAQAPKINAKVVYPSNNTSLAPTALEVTLDWTPSVTADPAGFFLPDTKAKLAIHVKITTPFADPTNLTYDISGSLSDFALQLFGSAASFIKVHFKSLAFKFSTGAKIAITPKIDTVTFEGPLTFINDLEQLLSSLGGPSIDLEPTGITASYSVPLPDVGVGVLDLQNLKLGASLTIPFDGTPVRVRFDLCTRDDPFILTISLFGGGGYFGLAIGADGIELIEVSLEFGAAISIDLGVASGGVSIMAGIYFSLQTTPSNLITLTGFLRADGNLEVLGIITLSIEFYLGFTYLNPGKAYGQATVTLTVKVLFFSASVSATMTKTIGGSGDPTFGQAITASEWATYCDAFAA